MYYHNKRLTLGCLINTVLPFGWPITFFLFDILMYIFFAHWTVIYGDLSFTVVLYFYSWIGHEIKYYQRWFQSNGCQAVLPQTRNNPINEFQNKDAYLWHTGPPLKNNTSPLNLSVNVPQSRTNLSRLRNNYKNPTVKEKKTPHWITSYW